MRILHLEWKKINKTPYIWAFIGMMAFSLFIAMLFLFLPQEELDLGNMERNWRFLSMLVSCVTLGGFTIIGAVMNARVTLEEYVGKRVLLLFSYPVERQTLFRIKTIICWCVTLAGAFIGNTAAILIAGGISNLFHVMSVSFGVKEFGAALFYSAIMAVLAGCVGLISLWFGFWKSSVIVEIVSALIMIMPVTNMLSAQIVFDVGMLVMILIALLISVVVFKKLEFKIRNMEVI